MIKTVAIIPLRAGSKSIPGKNKKRLAGRPLFCWTLGAAINSKIDEIYIFTDDNDILTFVKNEYSWTSKVHALKRDDQNATDTASTEAAMFEFSAKINYNFDRIVLLQATSPLTKPEDINGALSLLDNGYDSAVSVVEYKRFFWNADGSPINYDYLKRPRRQDFQGIFVENGAVYAATKDTFIKFQNRIGGKIGVVKMDESTLVEIDELNDFEILQGLIISDLKKYKKGRAKIQCAVFDVDGVFTDGTVATGESSEIEKRFSLRDGLGISMLRENGIITVVMTSEDSPIVRNRMSKLKVDYLFLGVKDKYSRLENFLTEKGIQRNEVAYVGDDINDLANIVSCGWGITPVNAVIQMKYLADFVTEHRGGDMAVRDVVNSILNNNSI